MILILEVRGILHLRKNNLRLLLLAKEKIMFKYLFFRICLEKMVKKYKFSFLMGIFVSGFCVIFLLDFVGAGPYGYGDSADLKYQINDGKITYGYGNGDNSVKYQTSLRPNNMNWTEWSKSGAKIVRGNKIVGNWAQISPNTEVKGESSVLFFNSLSSFLINKVSQPLFGLVNAKENPPKLNENTLVTNNGGCSIK